MKNRPVSTILVGALLGTGLFLPQLAHSHCDTMDGPVVQAARIALEQKDLKPVLKWVKPEGEAEIKAAFAKTLIVRSQSPEARDLADQFFFETLVRVHRAGEGAPYTGLKLAGTKLDPAVESADKALESGDIEPLLKLTESEVANGIRHRFADAREKKAHAEHNVEAGRAFVAAYVEYVHYVEALHTVAAGHESAHGHTEASVQTTGAAHAHTD